MRNLENYGVLELNTQEIREIDWGVLGFDDILVGLVIGAGASTINDWDNNYKDSKGS